MLEQIILGIIQGIAEWLPISSEGAIVLIKTNFFTGNNLTDVLRLALFLHLGTFLAALVYFRREVWQLLKALFKYQKANQEQRKILKFLILTTVISGGLGILLFKIIGSLEESLNLTGKIITLLVAVLLFITAGLQIKAASGGYKTAKELTVFDGILLGLAQGMAVLPGLSRSGLTISVLLLRKFDEALTLKLSFLMSLPIVLAGNIILNWPMFVWSGYNLIALFFAFIFGILTIDLLLKLARKINFGYFVLFFAVLMLIAVFV